MDNRQEQKERREWGEWLGSFIVRYRIALAVLFIGLSLLAGLGIQKITMTSSITEWFSEGSSVSTDRDRFENEFKKGERVALLVTGEDVFSHDMLNMIDRLGERLVKNVPFADRVESITTVEYSRAEGDEVITEELIPDTIPRAAQELEVFRDIALSDKLIAGRLVSMDSTETWVVIELLPFPKKWQGEYDNPPYFLVGEAIEKLLQGDDFLNYDIKAAGTPILNHDELVATSHETTRLVLYASIVAVILLIIFLRTWRGVVVPLLVTALSIAVVYGIYGHLGVEINAFLFNVPVFLAVAVTISYSIHLFNYFNEELSIHGDRKKAVIGAVRLGASPLLFSVLTTAAALASFVSVGLVPLRWLGLTGALVVLVVYVLSLLLTAVFLSFGKNQMQRKETEVHSSDGRLSRLGRWAYSRAPWVVAGFACLIGLFFIGITRFEVNLNLDQTYGFRVDYINRLREVAHSEVGSFSSYDITFDLHKQDATKAPELLRRFDRFVEKIDELSNTKRSTTMLPFLKQMNRVLHHGQQQYYRVPDSRQLVAQVLFLYEMSGGDELSNWINDDYSILRLQVETSTMDARKMVKGLEEIKALADRYMPEAEMSITGSMLETAIMNQYVAKGQIVSFLIALGVIGLLMIIILRSVRAGIIGLIPNVAPAVAIAGLMGFFGIPLDFITMTIVPMILGIAVDDTIHLMTHIKRIYTAGNSYIYSMEDSLRVVGHAMIMTSVVVVASFGIFGVSIFNMFRNLGIFMGIGLGTACASGLMMVPALSRWVSPFGKRR
ncbi:MMPL family transporter [Marispirochaeta sp.]|jgi:uncharacterized protein|uniref:efflux RND transporter permease subunit n=1 Tax=Marispirochaeta sp. TaxID=2038653 RepID=UPI0029C83C8B|nr:MMPL family transporter [Marispirochaeta sp.]